MDRTKRQARAAREQQLRNIDASAEDEVQDLEEIVLRIRERVKAAKAAKSRAAALRQELQDEEDSIAEEAAPVSAPLLDALDPGAFIAASLKSAVN